MAERTRRPRVVASKQKNGATLSPEAYKALEAARTSERDFSRALVLTARDYGFRLVYHTKFSIGSAPGFPDLVFLNDAGRCVIVEAKRVGKDPTEYQRDWLEALGKVAGVETYVWRPDSWDEIHAVLGRGWMQEVGA